MEENKTNLPGKQEYSCARCRRLKKRCTKESPACSSCTRLYVPCTYPGRAPRRTKKELEEAMKRGEYVPAKRRKKISKDSTSATALSSAAEVMSKETSLNPVQVVTNQKQPSTPNDNLKRDNNNVSLPSVNVLYNDVYSNVMKSFQSNNMTQTSDLPLSTTATVATAPPVTNQPMNDVPLYETVSALISSINSPMNSLTTTTAATTGTGTISTENMNTATQRTLSINTSSTMDISTTEKIGQTPLLSANTLTQQAQNSPITMNGRQNNMINIPRISSLPSMSTASSLSTPSAINYNPGLHINNIDGSNRFAPDPNLQQGKKINHSLTSLDNIRVSPVTVHPIFSNNMSHNHSVAPLSPSSVDNNNKKKKKNNGPTQIPTTTITTASAKYIGRNNYSNVDTNNGAQREEDSDDVPVENDDPYNIAKVESVPINSASIETATLGTIFKGGRVGTWVNEDGSTKPIDRNLLDRFIVGFFRHNYRLYPMIDKTSFLNQVSTIGEFDYDKLSRTYDPVFIFKLYMIMAIGCTTLTRAGMLLEDEEELSEHLAFLAMKNFCYVMNLQNADTIRCLLLLGIYSFFEPKGWSSWTISGIIMRLVIGLGLNRDLVGEKMKHMTVFEVEARYRVFWSAYCFERVVATCLGRASAIDDDDVTVPFPRPLNESEKEDIGITNTMIRLRMLTGRIYKQVHSTSVSKKKLTLEERTEIINGLRQELDTIFETEKLKMKQSNKNNNSNSNSSNSGSGSMNYHKQIASTLSFHSSDVWLAMKYSQLMILLYRPSILIPKPPIDSLSILGKYCLEAWKHTYTLYREKLLPLNWITLFRTLTICNIILYCLCQWTIDLIESKIEIQQCVEILDHFGSKWVFAKKCAKVFRNISNTILEISLSDGKVPNMDKLTTEMFGANDAYHEILNENNLDISWIDKLM